ncbi:hypothetical protein [Desulfallas thermosapovorans]|uniref:Uncharacterized protein n=1 Tax=Desulfallas thermosapovorans DSM 6562 TaxID=1121431 RepID=A0A5S4ZY20_9FIRM|nr:hypothetical protein [Desulfallas thermosapovorans]TYO97981.1 hypothetical protein LX24_00265 [Desulfallas thermosapovorans DSM 6562]
MDTACVLCNGLEKLLPRCPCGHTMVDAGPVTDYKGPYSPYFNMSFEDECCRHLFTCPACGTDRVMSIPLRKI